MGSFDKLKYKKYDPDKKGYGDPNKWKKAFDVRFAPPTDKPDHEFPTLAECTSADQLKKEYERLLKKYHPDKAGDTTENKQITQEIIAEYERLKDKF